MVRVNDFISIMRVAGHATAAELRCAWWLVGDRRGYLYSNVNCCNPDVHSLSYILEQTWSHKREVLPYN